jgi:hypothetical protein
MVTVTREAHVAAGLTPSFWRILLIRVAARASMGLILDPCTAHGPELSPAAISRYLRQVSEELASPQLLSRELGVSIGDFKNTCNVRDGRWGLRGLCAVLRCH